MSILKPIASRPTSLTEIVMDAIREAIVTRQLSPGDRITEATLAKQLDVSKTPVREALLKLEYIGLIESDGGRGGRIVTPTVASVRCAYEVRIGLEVQATRQLAARKDPAVVAAAREYAEKCLAGAESGDRAMFRDYDRRFHLELAAATGNGLLERLIHDAFDLTWTLRDRELPIMDDSMICAQQHISALTAIESGRVSTAEREMRGHIQWVLDLVVKQLEATGLN